MLAGKTVGFATVPAGAKVTLLKPEGDGFLVKREMGETFHVAIADLKPQEGMDFHEVAHDLGALNPVLLITKDHSILRSDNDLPVETTLTVTQQNFPKDATLTIPGARRLGRYEERSPCLRVS